MNKTLLSLFICFLAVNFSLVHAQEFSIGLKGGINKTYGGEISGIDSGIPLEYTSDTFTAEGEIGFHGGIWTQVNFGKFFIRPEIIYSKLESRFDFPQGSRLYEVEELSVPVLVGYNIFGPIDIYGGVAYKNILSSDISGRKALFNPPETDIRPIENPDLPLSGQIGVKAQFGSFGLDIRYDRSLASKKSQPVDFISDRASFSVPVVNRAVLEDARLDQIIVSLTVKLFDTANKDRRRRGGNCYF
ncbi:MAG: outer membrane beta-barrel protein [Bacteroidota bacterium]